MVSVGMAGYLPSIRGDDSIPSFILRMTKGQYQLVPEEYGKTDVWYFNNQIPGPQIRVKQGESFRVLVENRLDQSTTVHWHGLRVKNTMDGVPYLTQDPIEPGQTFLYELEAPDAGTFWYHPHQRSFEQVGRGLYGSLVVEERQAIDIDRELTWVLDDWRLTANAQLTGDYSGNRHDMSHAGRIGNTVTINGEIPDRFHLRRGERIRIRLINAANARIMALVFEDHEPKIISIDGQPVTPHLPKNRQYILAPGMRMDLQMDCTGRPGEKYALQDHYYPNQQYRLLDLVYDEKAVRDEILQDDIVLPGNPMPEPNLDESIQFEIDLAGGARGDMQGANFQGKWTDLRELVRQGKAWSINGVASHGHVMEPVIVVERNTSCILNIRNNTAWPHPMHLHGHSFRVLSQNDTAVLHHPWQDTVLIESGATSKIAFVADNPGDWMFHCHILEHQAAGMMAVIRVV